MKRPATVGGHTVPAATGRCARCHAPIGEPRAGSIALTQEKNNHWVHRLVCRDADGCHARRSRAGENPG